LESILGVAVVIALAMIISLMIAGKVGAVVPIALKKFGMKPAQSSSIVLTTITDIAGFMSFWASLCCYQICCQEFEIVRSTQGLTNIFYSILLL
jgi:hypothetical protein